MKGERNIFCILVFILLNALACSCSDGKADFAPVGYAKPGIGSVHGRWFFFTPAAVPFGMAKLAPHTNAYGSQGGWGPCGYDDRHSSIEGFGHFHEFQVGGVVFMPTAGIIQTLPGTLEKPDSGYRSRLNKGSELAEPGYYSVVLDDYKILAEITATERVGFHRYTFGESGPANLIIDIGHRQGESSDVTWAFARLVNRNEVEGYVETYPEYVKLCDPGKRVKLYFVARLSRPPDETGAFIDSLLIPGADKTEGTRNGLYLVFKNGAGGVLEIATGLSYTSLENARLNLQAEASLEARYLKFKKVTIQLDPDYYTGKELIIETENNAKENVYVRSVSLEGKALDHCWIERQRLMQGGRLLFEMGKQPDMEWGTEVPPPSMTQTVPGQ